MKVHLNSIPHSSELRVDLGLEIDEVGAMLGDFAGCRAAAPLEANATLRRRGARVSLEGALSTAVTANCRRCLERTEVRLEVEFGSTYLPTPEATSDEELDIELTSEDVELSYYDGEEIDLDPLIRETLLLEIDPNPLCDEACKGLCSKCGDNMNQGECGCDRTSYDLRWSALAELKKSKQ